MYLHWIGTFVKLKIRWIHMKIEKVPQNLENKLTSFYFSKTFSSGLIRRSREGSLFREYKNKIDKSEKSCDEVERF